MKINTQDLIGPALDWAVAKCDGVECDETHEPIWFNEDGLEAGRATYTPSTDWSQGGPIIEREKIDVDYWPDGDYWQATSDTYDSFGPTLLIAAMRCYIASQLGDEVDAPDELAKQ